MEDNNIEIIHTEHFLKWTSTTKNLHVVKVINFIFLDFQQLPVFNVQDLLYMLLLECICIPFKNLLKRTQNP